MPSIFSEARKRADTTIKTRMEKSMATVNSSEKNLLTRLLQDDTVEQKMKKAQDYQFKPTGAEKKGIVREARQQRGFRRGLPRATTGTELSPILLHKMYKVNPIVRISVDTIVDIVSSTKWAIVPINKSAEETKGIVEAETKVKQFFTRPNNVREPFRRIMRKWVKDLLLYDGAAFEKTGLREAPNDPDSNRKDLQELYAIDGGSINIQSDERGIISDYFQVLDGKDGQIRWDPKDLIYTMMYPSTDSIYGTSKLETLHNIVTAYLYLEKRNISFFENDSRPSGIVDLGPNINEDQMERFRSYWEADNKGTAHRIVITGGGSSGVKWWPISQNNKEMEMVKYLDWITRIIMLVYGVSPEDVGLRTSQARAGAVSQILTSAAFKVRAIYPILTELQFAFTEEIIRDEFGYDDVMFEFIEERSLQEKLQLVNYHSNMITHKFETPSEARLDFGLKKFTPEQKKELAEMQMQVGGGMAPGGAPMPGAGPMPILPTPPTESPVVSTEDKQEAYEELAAQLEHHIADHDE